MVCQEYAYNKQNLLTFTRMHKIISLHPVPSIRGAYSLCYDTSNRMKLKMIDYGHYNTRYTNYEMRNIYRSLTQTQERLTMINLSNNYWNCIFPELCMF